MTAAPLRGAIRLIIRQQAAHAVHQTHLCQRVEELVFKKYKPDISHWIAEKLRRLFLNNADKSY